MTGPRRIGVYFSQGHHFVSTLRRLREDNSSAVITAIVPLGYPFSQEIEPLIDDVVETERARYSIRDLGGCLRLVRLLRAGRYDLFVVLFDTPRLRILSKLSRSTRCACCHPDGHIIAIRSSILGTLAAEDARCTTGAIAFMGVWLAVHLLPVRPRQARRKQ